MTHHDRAIRQAFRDGYKAGERAEAAESRDGVEVALQKWESQNRQLFDVPTDLKSKINEIENALDRIKQQNAHHADRRRAASH